MNLICVAWSGDVHWPRRDLVCSRMAVTVGILATLLLHSVADGQGLDENWTVSVSGQFANVNPDGSFTVSSVSAFDNVGPEGLPPNDLLSDVPVRAVATATLGGVTYYAIGDCFQLVRLGDNSIGEGSMIITTTPPLVPVSIVVAAETETLTQIGQTTQTVLTATLGDGSVVEIDDVCGTYISSNPLIATISNTGKITAVGAGTALITATAEGAAGTTLVTVSPGDPLTTVVGIVMDESGTPLVGASVSLLGLGGTALTDATGAFAIPGVASFSGDIIARASVVVDGVQLVDVSDPVAPVSAGFTDVGLLVAGNRIAWVSPVSGSWHTASNWDGGFIPGTGNVAVIDVPGADITVTYSIGTTNLAALECSESFTLGAGTFSIDESSFIDKTYTCQNGSATLTGSGDLTISTSMVWNSGTMSGTGTTTIASGATLSLSSFVLARPLVNHGTGSLTSTSSFFQGGTLTNAADGLITSPSEGSVNFNNGSGTNAFINEGIFNQSSTGTTAVAVPFTSTGTVNVNQGTLSLSNTSTLSESINVAAGASLNFAGAVTFTLDASSTLDSDGTVIFQAGTTNVLGSYDSAITSLTLGPVVNFNTGQTITCPILTMGAGVLSGGDDFLVTGSLAWTGGTMSGPGTMTMASGATWSLGSILARTFVNHGSGTLTGSTGFQGVTLTNAEDGLMTVGSSGMAFTNGSGTNAFLNQGTFNQSGPVSASIGVPFTSTGTVNVNQSMLFLSNTSTISSTINVAPGATMTFGGGATHTLDASSSIDSAGTVAFEFGTMNVLGSYDSSITNLTLGPVVNFNTGQTITCPTLLVSSGFNPILSGGDDISVTGSLTFGGTMSGTGTTTLEAGSINTAPGNTTFKRLVVNHGTFTMSASPSFNNGTLTNAVDGVFISNGGFPLSNGGGTNAFNNEGIFNQSGTGTTDLLIPFTSNGTVNVNQGGLTLRDTSTFSGSINVAAGATLTFASVTNTLEASSSLDSGGTVIFESGTTHVLGSYDSPVTSLPFSGVVNFNTGRTITCPTLSMSMAFGGALSGGDDISVTGSLTWSNGTMSGTGTTTLEAGSTTTGPGSGGTVTFQRPVVNHGTFTTSGNATFNNGTLTNASDGVLTSNPSIGQSWSAGGGTNAFINEGIFNQSGTETTTLAIPFTNNGTTNIISSSLSLSGPGSVNDGIMAVSTGATLSIFTAFTNAQAGELRGTGTLNTLSATLTQAGIVAPGASPGVLTVIGNLPNTSTAMTNIEIGGRAQGTEYDSLSVSGAATLDGTLNLSLINGFQPRLGQTFTIMTYGSFTGAFDTITGLNLGNGLVFMPTFGPTSLTLTVVSR